MKPRVRASSIVAGRTCPGSVRLDLENNVTSEYAELGKIGHRWLELRVGKGKEAANEYLAKQDVTEGFRLSLGEFWLWFQESHLVPMHDHAEVYTEADMIWSDDDAPYIGTGTVDLVSVSEGVAYVADYKFYNDPSALPSMHFDYQMYAYAVAALKKYDVDTVIVYRVLCYHLSFQELVMDLPTLELAAEALDEVARHVVENPDTFNVGAQCQRCFQRAFCPAAEEVSKSVDTSEMTVYTGGAMLGKEQALKFLLAAPIVSQRISDGYQAIKEFVDEHGPVIDDTTGKAWEKHEVGKDTIVDAPGCLDELIKEITPKHASPEAKKRALDRALMAASTTKSAMELAMKASSVRSSKRRSFFYRLREKGLIERVDGVRYEWRKQD